MTNAVSTPATTSSLIRWFRSGCPPGWVGGRLELTSTQAFHQGEFLLLGQGCRLHVKCAHIDLSHSPLQPSSGSQVSIYIPGKLELDPISGLSLQIFQINEPIRMVVMSVPQTSPPSVGSSFHIQEEWFRFLRDVEDIFSDMGLLRVGTPSLVVCPGMEPTLEPMSVNFKSRFLPTSPELHLKKLLAQNYTDFFEIRSCFRVEVPSPHHEPEFTLLEWYRGFASSSLLIQDLEALLKGLQERDWPLPSNSIQPLQIRTLQELFKEFARVSLSPSTSKKDLWAALNAFNLRFEETWTWDDCFHLLFLEKIEPHLGAHGPELICNYPPSQAALAKLTSEGWADRMELYWHGLEIANGFGELTDAASQQLRFADEMRIRKERGLTEVPLDCDFLQALKAGIPPSAGMALGLERLFMVITRIKEIQEIKLFPERS